MNSGSAETRRANGVTVLRWGHLVRVHILQKLATERLLCCAAFAGIQVQHVVKQIQGCGRYAEQREQNHRFNTLVEGINSNCGEVIIHRHSQSKLLS